MQNDELIALLAADALPTVPHGTTAASAGGFVGIFGPAAPRFSSRAKVAADAARRMAWLEALMPAGALLPAMPGTQLAHDELPGMVEANRALLERAASEVAGKVQFQVTVGSGDAAPLQGAMAAAELARRLYGLTDSCHALPVHEALISNHVILIEAFREADLDAALAEIDETYPGLEIRQIGPAPAVSFASLRLRRVSSRRIRAALRLLGLGAMPDGDALRVARRAALLAARPGRQGAIREAADILAAAIGCAAPAGPLILAEIWSEGRGATAPHARAAA
ncbi:hypothetical protein OCH239_11845 [Roseivivax halodurans JCM 10272]|uniref:Uncharacterized protein n=1 Tax=Roseivivax halodurans JCM 10272 TaxID=1449350 RepID=X7ELB4_9RHOB|nr:GvpL/GvpF family gas vesicle protein [Roseivivax halodurans]ETX15946.1 hypothetical protein OCH239_11845 [Roseivivax halodurans JCM 10272]